MRAVRVDVKRCAVRPGGARVPSLACSRTKAKSPSDPRSRTRVLRYTRSRPGMSGKKNPPFGGFVVLSGSIAMVNIGNRKPCLVSGQGSNPCHRIIQRCERLGVFAVRYFPHDIFLCSSCWVDHQLSVIVNMIAAQTAKKPT